MNICHLNYLSFTLEKKRKLRNGSIVYSLAQEIQALAIHEKRNEPSILLWYSKV